MYSNSSTQSSTMSTPNAMENTQPYGGLGEYESAVLLNGDINDKLVHVFFKLARGYKCDSAADAVSEFTEVAKYVFEQNLSNYKPLCTRMISHTRDIIDGKGEYELSYRMLLEFALANTKYNEMAEKTKQLIYYMVRPIPLEGNSHPHGSWKDIKNFLNHVRDRKEALHKMNSDESDTREKLRVCNDLISYCLNLYVMQLRSDLEALNDSRPQNISLCAKWVPRENSKYSWVFVRLARYIFNADQRTRPDQSRDKQYFKKFRTMIASLSKAIDTLEIKQCGNRYADIDFSKVPGVAMSLQKKAFMNMGRHKSQKEDRLICADKFKDYMSELYFVPTRSSGYSLKVTNNFLKNGVDGLMLNPHEMMMYSLENPRYDVGAFVDVDNGEWISAISNKNMDSHREYIRENAYKTALTN